MQIILGKEEGRKGERAKGEGRKGKGEVMNLFIRSPGHQVTLSFDAGVVLLYGKAYRMGLANIITIPENDYKAQQIVPWR